MRGAWTSNALPVVLALLIGMGAGAARAQGEPPLVAAASDLQFALAELRDRFRGDTGQDLRLSFGSSGNIARQLKSGAPYQLFMSADEAYVLDLAGAGLTRDAGALYAVGRVALFVADGSPLAADGSLGDLAAALADGRLSKLAIANPEHAPYGRAAMQALQHRGLWEAIRPRLVYGENVSQAAQFAASRAAQGGIIALSLAQSPQLSQLGRFALIPADWHAPLNQRMVLTRQAGVAAERFFAYLQGPAAREILARHGFTLPSPPN